MVCSTLATPLPESLAKEQTLRTFHLTLISRFEPVRHCRAITAGSAPVGLLVFCLLIAIAPSRLPAQGRPVGRLDAVFLDVDSMAVKKLGAARDFLSAGQFGDAIELLRQIREQHGSRLVPISDRRYITVSTYCDILITGLPPEGLKLYRTRTDPQAQRWYEQGVATSDETQFQRVVQQAFASSYGDDALLMLGDLAWERGALATARDFWQQLVPLPQVRLAGDVVPIAVYPDSDLDVASIRARVLLCSLFERNLHLARWELAAFHKDFPKAEGTLAGRTGNLAEILDDIATEIGNTPPISENPTVATFAFNMQRSKILPRTVDVGAVQWATPLPLVREADTRPFRMPGRGPVIPLAGVLAYFPVVYGDTVLFCDEVSIYAYNLYTGKPAWPTGTGGADNGVLYTLPVDQQQGLPSVQPGLGLPRFTLTIDQGRLYARLGQVGRFKGNSQPRPSSLLVCLDLREEGKLVWSIDSESLQVDGEEWAFEGAPVVSDGRLFCGLRRSEPQPQSNVASFDVENGRLIWNRKVCTGTAGPAVETYETSHHLLTLANGRVYYSTDLGVVVALEAREGTLNWAVTYPRIEFERTLAYNRRQKVGPVPCVYHQGTVFAAPTDSNAILAIDASTGILKWECQMAGGACALLGVGSERLIVTGDRLSGLDINSGEIRWQVGTDDPEDISYGRGLLAEDEIYWPTREELIIVEQATGALRRRIPLKVQHQVTGGNLVIAGGMLLVAEANRLVAFGEYGRLKQKLRERLSQVPDDPRSALRLAGLLQAGDLLSAAADMYQTALDRAGEDDRWEGCAVQSLARRRFCECCWKIARQELAADRLAPAIEALTRLVTESDSPPQRLQGFLSLGECQARAGSPKAAVASYQQILDSPELSHLLLQQRLRGDVLACQRITRLISEHGHAIYQPVEARARQEFETAESQSDINRLRQAVRRFPNAECTLSFLKQSLKSDGPSAEFALLSVTARWLASMPIDDVLRQKLREDLAAADRSRQVARQALASSGTTNPADAVVFHRGPSSTDGLPVDELAARQAAAPLRRLWSMRGTGRGRLLIPHGVPLSELTDRRVLLFDRELNSIDSRTGHRNWQMPVPEQPSWCAFGNSLLYLKSAERMTAMQAGSGELVWSRPMSVIGATSVSGTRIVSAEESPRPAVCPIVATSEERLCLLFPGEGVVALDPYDGTPAWMFAGNLNRFWAQRQGQLLVQALGPDRNILIDVATGMELQQGRSGSGAWIRDPLWLGKETVAVHALGHVLQLYDVRPGTTRWTYQGPMSHANRAPEWLSNGSRLGLVIDGDTFASINLTDGGVEWSAGLGAIPVNPATAVCLDDQQVYAVSGGIMRCLSLETGKRLWDRYLGETLSGEWRIALQPKAVAAWGSSRAGLSLIVCRSQTGLPVQKFSFPTGAEPLIPAEGQRVCIISSPGQMVGLGPRRH